MLEQLQLACTWIDCKLPAGGSAITTGIREVASDVDLDLAPLFDRAITTGIREVASDAGFQRVR